MLLIKIDTYRYWHLGDTGSRSGLELWEEFFDRERLFAGLTFMSRGRRTHDHEIIKNRDFDREVFFRLETELFHVNEGQQRVGTASSSCREAVAGAPRTAPSDACGRCTSHSRRSKLPRSSGRTTASCHSA